MKKTDIIRAYLAKIGAKGGATKGPTKRRGGVEYYRDMVQRRIAAQKARKDLA